jgi:hypothetical protein
MRRVVAMRGQVSNKPKWNLTFAELVEKIRVPRQRLLLFESVNGQLRREGN